MQEFGVVGYPLVHSLSPYLFNRLFRLRGWQAVYRRFELKSLAALPQLVSCRLLKGLNITIPHKHAFFPFCDVVHWTAQVCGAVNVVRIERGRTVALLFGANTDLLAFMEVLREVEQEVSGRKALVLGSGGVSTAVQYALRAQGWEVQVVSRSPERGDLTYEALDESICGEVALVVNCTPLGMYPHLDGVPPLPYHCFGRGQVAIDLVYNPPDTLFLKKCRRQGCKVVSGVRLFVLQAWYSLRWWMGDAFLSVPSDSDSFVSHQTL